jgi:hypothetical protein
LVTKEWVIELDAKHVASTKKQVEGPR